MQTILCGNTGRHMGNLGVDLLSSVNVKPAGALSASPRAPPPQKRPSIQDRHQ